MNPSQETPLPTHIHFRFAIRRAWVRSRRNASKSRLDTDGAPMPAGVAKGDDGMEMGSTPVQCILVNDVMMRTFFSRRYAE